MTDYTDYKNLYLLCFAEDTEEDAEFLFKTVLSKAENVCEYKDGKPIAMLFLMEANLISKDAEYPFFYLYAACTHPEYRGKGIMGRLLEKAKEVAIEKGKMGIFLKPANPSLFDFYKKSDFSPFFSVRKINASAEAIKDTDDNVKINLTELTMAEWHSKRKEFLCGQSDLYADFSKDLFAAATDGCRVVMAENSAAVYELRDNTLLVKEAVCRKEKEKELINLLVRVVKETNPKNVEVRFPPSFDLSLPDGLIGNPTPFSVIWDNGNLPKEDISFPYHGFAFD
ncbi:MAG: GNAT family N-acetyltransferase [Acutalibacteraceae bacterium]|nr:GNAT family N-acetyltransferase [Acutalibacteraceae bacterium]